ncbi:hypothetical protein TNCV_3117341 [Trichonephila clavipes]|nr:hypothetical protein TNCV_3117341 [Trichonephila clavipes]
MRTRSDVQSHLDTRRDRTQPMPTGVDASLAKVKVSKSTLARPFANVINDIENGYIYVKPLNPGMASIKKAMDMVDRAGGGFAYTSIFLRVELTTLSSSSC